VAILGDRPAVLARELTKLHEEFLRGRLSEILAGLKRRESVKGECTLLVAGAPTDPAPVGPEELDAAIEQALAQKAHSLKALSKALADRFQVSRKQVYERALQLKPDDGTEDA